MVLRHTGTSAERILKDRRLFLEFFYLHFNDFTIVSLRLINDYKSCSTIIFSLKTKKTKKPLYIKTCQDNPPKISYTHKQKHHLHDLNSSSSELHF